MSIKPTTGSTASVTTPESGQTKNTQAPSTSTITQPVPTINPEAVSKALKEYQKMRDKLKDPAFKGAAGLFTDSVVFPNELLDPNNPENDPRFLHLLLAVFGMKEMKQFFETDDQKEEEDEESEEDSQENSEEQKSKYKKK